jgi:predicted DNA-binding transcriptional regulator AlpA
MNGEQVRKLIMNSLRDQGFRLCHARILPPRDLDKQRLRELHAQAVEHRIERSRTQLIREEPRLLERLAPGWSVVPELVQPRLVEVQPGSEDELLFRYATLHWSIPVSSGYGRRIRFLVIDEHNGKLMGLFGLGDPVFNLAARDTWIGWDSEMRRRNLHHVMDAFVLGAVPPYSSLLCGKLVAMLAASNEVRKAIGRKYAHRRALIMRRALDGRIALITTTSALGRSSIYNRIKYGNRHLFYRVGFTQGSGEFHFANGLYNFISRYAERYCQPTAKKGRWGTGFRNRREVVRKVLAKVGLSSEWIYHGVRREVYAVPLAANTRQFLTGEHKKLLYFDQPADDLFRWFRERWLLPRARRDFRYREFVPSSYRLWNGRE